MKKFLLCFVLLAFIATTSLFAWEPSDLTTYPSIVNEKSWLLNVGVGLGDFPKSFDANYFWIPPVRVTLDKNVPLGGKGLPFFFGGHIGFSGHGYKHKNTSWFYGNIPIGARFGYHFNFGVDKLDVYAVTSAGWVIYLGDNDFRPDNLLGLPFLGVNVGARYFFTDNLGVWAEVGYTSVSWLDIGLTFKF